MNSMCFNNRNATDKMRAMMNRARKGACVFFIISFFQMMQFESFAAPVQAAEPVFGPPVPAGERLVGLAYTTWHQHPDWNLVGQPKHPKRPWKGVWGTPILGFYRSDDTAVIRRHAEWIAGAGVDFIFVDWSNNVNHVPGSREGSHEFIERATTRMLEEFAALEQRPRVVIMLGTAGHPEALSDGRLQRKADQVHREYVQNPRFRPLMQDYLGKPLMMVYTDTPTPYGIKALPQWDDARFTVRWVTGFLTEQRGLLGADKLSKLGYWSWEDRGEQTVAVHAGHPEAMTVVACWRPSINGTPSPGRRDGATFLEQWRRAHEIGPKFALVVSWNEWWTGEQPSPEISKDLEPSKAFGHRYLDLLRQEVKRFKSEAKP